MTAYMASSRSLAGRPRSSVMAAASSSVRPSSRWRARVMDGKLQDIPGARLGLDIAIALRQNKANASQDQTFKVADVRLSQGGARRGSGTGKSRSSLSGNGRGPQAEAGPQADRRVGAEAARRRSRRAD